MEPYFNPITKEGYQALESQIQALKESRPTKIRILQEARALGDLSENADYSAAKRDLRHLESRLRYLQKQLQYAKVYTPSANSIVELGKLVTIEYLDDQEVTTLKIVGVQEADAENNRISIASPMGKALLNHSVNDLVTIEAPQFSYQIKIINITIQEES